MRTVEYANWGGDISQLGAIYPFVGYEMYFFLICVAFWLFWHFCQASIEEKELAKEKEIYNEEKLQQILKSQLDRDNL